MSKLKRINTEKQKYNFLIKYYSMLSTYYKSYILGFFTPFLFFIPGLIFFYYELKKNKALYKKIDILFFSNQKNVLFLRLNKLLSTKYSRKKLNHTKKIIILLSSFFVILIIIFIITFIIKH